MTEVVIGSLFGLLTAIVAVLLPLAIRGRRAARVKDRLIADVVLGDEDRGMPSLVERDKALRDLIADRTAQIQPDTNHGKSLADLHRKIDAKFDRLNETVETHLGESIATWQQIRDRLAELERDRAAAHIEAIEMWQAIGKVADSPPPKHKGGMTT